MITVIVVLGNKSGQTSLNRVNSAIAKKEELLKKDPLQRIWFILSGANGEAEFMRDCLVSQIPDHPAERIIVENLSLNTYQNIQNSYELVNNIFGDEDVTVTFCTSVFHIKRVVVVSTLLNIYRFTLAYHYCNDYNTREYDKYESQLISSFLDEFCFSKL
jgi:uncharacterized SAM-binding protein YcdF (DUF218 family)